MVITDPRQPDNPIVLANRAFLDLTGYTAEEVLGHNCRFLHGEATAPAAVDIIRQCVVEQREVQVEILNYRKDGSTFWNQLALSPVHDEAGALLYFFASQIDVTELRKVQLLEATENRLLNEVDHRARNALAVVSSIVRLSRSDDAERYALAVQRRIKALADAHTLLAECGWRAASIASIIRQQVPIDRAQITLSGPDLLVSALAVQPLALVIHELLDNAAIHGALSRPDGALAISWADVPDTGAFALHWQETGGPEPQSSRPRGFGAAMMTAMIERQLGGQVQRDWGPQGLTVTMVIPSRLDALASSAF